MAKPKNLREYLKELREARKEKPEQIKEALDIYSDLWEKAIEKGIVSQEDGIEVALSKVDSLGGLYKAAEG